MRLSHPVDSSTGSLVAHRAWPGSCFFGGLSRGVSLCRLFQASTKSPPRKCGEHFPDSSKDDAGILMGLGPVTP